MGIELIIEHKNKIYGPPVVDDITWTTERIGTPGQLNFTILYDGIPFAAGDAVRLKVDNKKMFYGFIFALQTDKDKQIKITAYDQLRYLKNKNTYVYKNKTAAGLIRMIASDFRLQTGKLEDTKYKIASRVEDNVTLFDMIQNAIDITLQNTNQLYVLFDDFGKITVKNVKNMKLNFLVDKETAENYDYSSSIDEETYNKIKLVRDNEKTGKRDVYIAQDGKHMNSWGVLQYFDTLEDGENGKAKANALLKLYNQKTRNLTIKNVFGNSSVRAGSLIGVILTLPGLKINNRMLVEQCKHTFSEGEHFMDLTLSGGGFDV